jgi:hypothetical protein
MRISLVSTFLYRAAEKRISREMNRLRLFRSKLVSVSFPVLVGLLAISGMGAIPAFGQGSSKSSPSGKTAASESNAPAETVIASGFDYRSTAISDLVDTGSKFLSLAQATPADKFTWRPAGEGAYSFSELYLLAASLYYHLPYEFGAIRAAGYEFEGDDVTGGRSTAGPFEKSTTNKNAVVLELSDSLAYFKNIIPTLTDADLEKPIMLSGKRTTPDGGLFLMANDLHDYLAQAVVYARINGVSLHWMDEEQQRREKQGQRKPAR